MALKKILLNAFDRVEKLRVSPQVRAIQIKKLLVLIAPNQAADHAGFIGRELCNDKRTDLQALNLIRIQLEIGSVVQDQIFFQRFQLSVADHHLAIKAAH